MQNNNNKIRVKIERHPHKLGYWYKNLIGQEFDVKHFTAEFYMVDDGTKRCILKSDCSVIPPEKLSRNNTEIFDQKHQMWAEGSEDFKMTYDQVAEHVLSLGWKADGIAIWFDDMQKVWRWHCNIESVIPPEGGEGVTRDEELLTACKEVAKQGKELISSLTSTSAKIDKEAQAEEKWDEEKCVIKGRNGTAILEKPPSDLHRAAIQYSLDNFTYQAPPQFAAEKAYEAGYNAALQETLTASEGVKNK